MIYNGKYYSALNDGHICTDGNWYPNDTCHKDYYTNEWVSTEQDTVVFLNDEMEWADTESDKFEAISCMQCGEYYASDDTLIFTEDTQEYYCEDCAERYCQQCEDCGAWYYSDINNLTSDSEGTLLCEACVGNYYICEECGIFVSGTEIEFGQDYEVLCSDCYREYKDMHPIKSYHEHMDYTPLVTEEQKNMLGLKLFGFEIEVECDEELAKHTLELLNGYAELQHDSSVDGFEIITRPMTKEFFYDVFVNHLNKALDYLKQNGALAHNKGGIHIHFSTNNISINLQESNLLVLTYCVQGTEEGSKKFEIIRELSQRTQQELLNWASPYITSRYGAIHYDERTNTYEMRIFNSNLRIERVIKNFEVLLSMIEYSETLERGCMTMEQYLEWVMQTENRYECLKRFIKEKHIDKYIKSNNWLDIFKRESEVLQCA